MTTSPGTRCVCWQLALNLSYHILSILGSSGWYPTLNRITFYETWNLSTRIYQSFFRKQQAEYNLIVIAHKRFCFEVLMIYDPTILSACLVSFRAGVWIAVGGPFIFYYDLFGYVIRFRPFVSIRYNRSGSTIC